MTLLSSVGAYSRLSPPIPPEPGFLSEEGTFFSKNLTEFGNIAIPNNISPEGIFVSSDGTRVFVIGGSGVVYQYDLSVPFDISTITYNSVSIDLSSNTGTSSSNRDLFFDDSGTRLYVISDSTDKISQFTLSTAWDISTATYDNKQFVLTSPSEASHRGLSISSDGSKFFVIGQSTDSVYEFRMTTLWDISTSVYQNRSFSVATYETSPEGLTVTPDGRSLIIVGTVNDVIVEFELASSWNLTSVTYKGRQFSLVSLQPVVRAVQYHEDGYLFLASQTNNSISSFKLGSDLLGVSPLSVVNKGYKVLESTGTRVTGIRYDAYGSSALIMKSGTIYEYYFPPVQFEWDWSKATYSGNTYDADPQNLTIAQNFFFDPSGLKYYVVGYNNTNISQYDISVSFKPSNPSFVASKSFSAGTGGLNMGSGAAAMGFYIVPDGTKLFIALSNTTYGRGIFRADFGTPWDVSTLSTDLTKTNYKFLNANHGISGIIIVEFSFSADGKKLYLYDREQKRIYQFNLSAPYSLGAATMEKFYSTNYLDSSGFSYANFFTVNGVNPNGSADQVIFHGNSRYFITQFDF